ncbi:MAG: hypothetical protein ACRCVT_05855 [Leadbetterella sp.]
MVRKSICLCISLALLIGCSEDTTENDTGKVMGYKPIYANTQELSKITFQSPRKLKKPAKIYIKGNYLFINELNEGIHVFNNIDPQNPRAVGFISIIGNQDMEVKKDILYADNGVDLIAIDISNPESVNVVKRVEKVFPYSYFPEQRGVKFECPDPSKGIVLRWELTELVNPKCYR